MDYIHPPISDNMQEVYKTYEDKADANKQQIIVMDKFSGIPGEHEDCKCDNNAEKLS
jgi:hypothetical protein